MSYWTRDPSVPGAEHREQDGSLATLTPAEDGSGVWWRVMLPDGTGTKGKAAGMPNPCDQQREDLAPEPGAGTNRPHRPAPADVLLGQIADHFGATASGDEALEQRNRDGRKIGLSHEGPRTDSSPFRMLETTERESRRAAMPRRVTS